MLTSPSLPLCTSDELRDELADIDRALALTERVIPQSQEACGRKAERVADLLRWRVGLTAQLKEMTAGRSICAYGSFAASKNALRPGVYCGTCGRPACEIHKSFGGDQRSPCAGEPTRDGSSEAVA